MNEISTSTFSYCELDTHEPQLLTLAFDFPQILRDMHMHRDPGDSSRCIRHLFLYLRSTSTGDVDKSNEP